MKNIYKFLGILSLFLFLLADTFALDAPSNLKITSKTDTSVSLSWSSVNGAFMYYVYYTNDTGTDKDFSSSTDFIEGTSTVVDGLKAGENYSFVVTALNEDGDESVYSNEVSTSKVANGEFALDGIEVISKNKIDLKFTKDLQDIEDATREFKITNKADISDTYEVLSTELDEDDSSILELELDKELEIGNEYEVVVVAISSAEGKNIESGIDSTETFKFTEITNKTANGEFVEGEEMIGGDEMTEFNSAGPSGEIVDGNEETTLSVADQQDKLPQTGPEHIFLLIVAVILGGLVFAYKYKKA